MGLKKIITQFGYYKKPSFLIIGTQKAGTTSLFYTLNQHSMIQGSSIKEIHFFDNDEWYSKKKMNEYHTFFPLPHQVKKNTKLFEATPDYLFHPKAAQRLFSYNPNLKLIILLRSPAERALSAWTMFHHHFKIIKEKKHMYDSRNFIEAISDEINNFDNSDFYTDFKAYIKRGIYFNQIETYLSYFPRNQFLFIESGDLYKNHTETMKEIYDFLSVPFEVIDQIDINKSQVDSNKIYAQKILELKEFYKPYNEKLFNSIGKKFNW